MRSIYFGILMVTVSLAGLGCGPCPPASPVSPASQASTEPSCGQIRYLLQKSRYSAMKVGLDRIISRLDGNKIALLRMASQTFNGECPTCEAHATRDIQFLGAKVLDDSLGIAADLGLIARGTGCSAVSDLAGSTGGVRILENTCEVRPSRPASFDPELSMERNYNGLPSYGYALGAREADGFAIGAFLTEEVDGAFYSFSLFYSALKTQYILHVVSYGTEDNPMFMELPVPSECAARPDFQGWVTPVRR